MLERQPPAGVIVITEIDIRIRRSEPDDYRAIQAVYSQPNVIRGTLQTPFPSLESWKKKLAEPPEGLTALVAEVDSEVVGTLVLAVLPRSPRRRHVGMLAIAVHDAWQGRGIGTALLGAAVDLADRWLNLTRLELTVYTDNEPAIRLYEKFGFKVEGTLSNYAFRDGEYSDVLALARVR